jgi:hypothetical protein
MAVITLKFDFDKLREIVALGVRRATVFMGIGSNAALVQPPISHVLSDRTQFHTVPVEVSEATQKEFLTEFEKWVIANGFRELAETFSIFLTSVYVGYVGFDRGKMDAKEFQKLGKAFSRYGLSDQFTELRPLLDIDARFEQMFASINQARNCLAHRRGIVGPPDVPAPGQPFVFHWHTMGMELEDGTDVSMLLNTGDPFHVEAEQKLVVGPVDRSKTFQLGDPIGFARYELNEICFGVTMAMEHIRSKLIDFARSKGFTVEAPQPAPAADPDITSSSPEEAARAAIANEC